MAKKMQWHNCTAGSCKWNDYVFPLIMTMTLHSYETTFHNTHTFNMAQAYFYIKGYFPLFAFQDASKGKQTAFKSTMPSKNLQNYIRQGISYTLAPSNGYTVYIKNCETEAAHKFLWELWLLYFTLTPNFPVTNLKRHFWIIFMKSVLREENIIVHAPICATNQD